MTNKDFLERAVKLAGKGIEEGAGPFGALVVRNGEIISESTNRVVQSHDPTAHAEVLAIREAAQKTATHDLQDCILYSSCEPCPMCLGAIYWSGIKKVYFAADRKDAAMAGFNDEFIYDEINLLPEKRNVSFKRIKGVDGQEVFKKWERFENKVQY
jgi:tRNA(Arg) A34 adenosine deaminase TadA